MRLKDLKAPRREACTPLILVLASNRGCSSGQKGTYMWVTRVTDLEACRERKERWVLANGILSENSGLGTGSH